MPSGTELEIDVQRVYSYLLNMKDEGIVVARRASLKGKTGVSHEIDVYYCFEHAGVRHQVGIECKDLARAAPLKEIRDFNTKLQDIGNIIGIFVTRNGLQRGARDFASGQGIITLRFDELPSLPTLIADRIQSIAFPDRNAVGEPFWTFMEVSEGKLTGSYFATSDFQGRRVMPLTLSKQHAKRLFGRLGLNRAEWQIRGLPRYSLRAFVLNLELQEKLGRATAAIVIPGAKEVPSGMGVTSAYLRSDFLDGYDDGAT